MKRLLIIILIVVSVIPYCVNATANGISFFKLGMKDGLSQPSIMSIYQDELGSFWFGTREGLNRYDQSGIEVFTPQNGNPNSIFGERVRQICGDGNGRIFILTNCGVSEYNLRTKKFTTIYDTVCTAISYNNNNLLIARFNQLFYYDKNQLNLLYEFAGDVSISKVKELNNGNIIIGTLSSGLYHLENRERLLRLLPNIGEVSVIYEDSKNEIWIGSNTTGLYCFQGTRLAEHYFTGAKRKDCLLMTDFVRDICEDNSGNMWIGTSRGLTRLDVDKQKIENFEDGVRDSEKLSDNSIQSLYKDSQGSIWIGTYFGGVNYFNPGGKSYEFLNISCRDKSNGASQIIGNIVTDEDGNLFLITKGDDVIHYDVESKDCHHYTVSRSHDKYSITTKIETAYYDESLKMLWLGLHYGGLCKLDPSTGHYTIFDGYHNLQDAVGILQSIRVIKPYGENSLLVGAHSGLYLFDKTTNKFRLFSEKIQEHNHFVADVILDNEQNLWVAGNGLIRYNIKTGNLKEYHYDASNHNSLGSNNMERLFVDSKNRLWVATGGGGLNLYDSVLDSFHRFNQQNAGLKNNYIGNIAESNMGNLILLHTKGITLFDPINRKAYNYGSENDFPISSGYGGDVCVDSNGRIYISGIDGIISFTEKDLKQEYAPFKLEFQELTVNDHKVTPGDSTGILKSSLPYTDKIDLKYDQTILSISFISNNYIPSNQVAYEYQMLPLSNQWAEIPSGTHRLNFMHLAEGGYTLKIRGRWIDSEHIICEKRLLINVSPPFYRSWWAILIYIGIAVALIYLYNSFTKSKLKLKTSLEYEKKEKENIEQSNQSKLRFFTNISHEFRTPLTLILGQIEMLLQITKVSPAAYKKILSIRRNANYMQNLITELLEFRKYEHGNLTLKVTQVNLKDFLDDTYGSFLELARLRNITFKVDKDIEDISVWIDRIQMQKVFYNLISNAFKFTSEGGNVDIGVKETEDKIIISVTDNGIGISEEFIEKIFRNFYQVENSNQVNSISPGTGIGLALSELIIEAHHGKISVSSAPGVGSCFSVSILKGKSHFEDTQISDENSADSAIIRMGCDSPLLPTSELFPEEIMTGNRPHILVVEDNNEIGLFIKEIFSPVFNVTLAKDGLDGYNKALEVHPDIILSDIMMPNMSGIELCRKIKENSELCHIPVVLLTAKTTIESNIEGLQNGADDYITKPFNIDTLIIRCNNLINNRRLLQKKFSSQPDVPAKVLATNKQDLDFIEKLCAVIDSHIEDADFDIPRISAELSMSRSKLFAKIKGITGQTPHEFIMNIKLKKASKYLRENMEMPVSDIAYILGFGSPKYFGKCFKDQFGVSPTDYRKGKVADVEDINGNEDIG